MEAFNRAVDDPSDASWQASAATRRVLAETWAAFFETHDVLILPVSYGPAFRKTVTGTPIPGDGGAVPYIRYVPYAYVFNATGNPAITIPLGVDADGLPIGVQVVGPPYSEDELIRFAQLIEPFTSGFVRPAGR